MRKPFTLAVVLLAALSLFALPSFGDAKPAVATVGAVAPAFSLEDQAGQKVSLADFKDKIVVLEWFNEGCPFVQRHHKAQTMSTLAGKYKEKGVVWLAINPTPEKTNETNKKAAEAFGLSFPILNDSAQETARAYGAKTTPHMFIIDKAGKVAYIGAIDDDPNGEKAEKVNYVDKALGELTAGGSVTTAETKPYGCGVKYK